MNIAAIISIFMLLWVTFVFITGIGEARPAYEWTVVKASFGVGFISFIWLLGYLTKSA